MKVIEALLQHLHVEHTSYHIKRTLASHPHHPGLLSISDLLDEYNIDNAAIELERENFTRLEPPFIAKTYPVDGTEFYLVTQLSEKEVKYMSEVRGWVTEPLESFMGKWTNFVIVAEKTDLSVEPRLDRNRRNEWIEKWRLPLSLLLFGVLVLSTVFMTAPTINLLLAGALFATLAGIVVSIMLLIQMIDKDNPFVKKICDTASSGGCEGVLSSSAALLPGGLMSWSEVGFFYFSGSFFALLFASDSAGMMHILAWVNLLALPYTVFSVYYQKFVVKQWCVLCLTVQVLLWLEFILLYPRLLSGEGLNGSNLLVLLWSFALPVILWMVIKPFVTLSQQVLPLSKEVNKFKKNPEVFYTLLQSQEKVEIPDDDMAVITGNANASFSIMIITNPYCAPCGAAHKDLKKLLDEYPDKLKIITLFSPNKDNEHDPKNLAMKWMIALYLQQGQEVAARAFHDWYEKKYDSFGKWSKQYPADISSPEVERMLNRHRSWCDDAEISHTPTIYINGYPVLQEYGIEDLKYFIQSASK